MLTQTSGIERLTASVKYSKVSWSKQRSKRSPSNAVRTVSNANTTLGKRERYPQLDGHPVVVAHTFSSHSFSLFHSVLYPLVTEIANPVIYRNLTFQSQTSKWPPYLPYGVPPLVIRSRASGRFAPMRDTCKVTKKEITTRR